MPLSTVAKFGFRIRTKSGSLVDNLSFSGKDESDAERKLRQIYMGCEILEVKPLVVSAQLGQPMNFEDVVDLISDPAAPTAGD